MPKNILAIQNLSVSVAGKQIIKNIFLNFTSGSVHLLMGPNGSGKTTLARTIIGDSSCIVQKGEVFYEGVSILSLAPDERARKGIFLAFQNPPVIPGLTVFSFLQQAYNARFATVIGAEKFRDLLYKNMDFLNIDELFAFRDLNVGFSGGEKKRLELLQLFVLKPKVAILDEIDSGLDIDAQKLFAQAFLVFKKENQDSSFLIISHNKNFVQQINPDQIHVFQNGELIHSGDSNVLKKIQKGGYESFN